MFSSSPQTHTSSYNLSRLPWFSINDDLTQCHWEALPWQCFSPNADSSWKIMQISELHSRHYSPYHTSKDRNYLCGFRAETLLPISNTAGGFSWWSLFSTPLSGNTPQATGLRITVGGKWDGWEELGCMLLTEDVKWRKTDIHPNLSSFFTFSMMSYQTDLSLFGK